MSNKKYISGTLTTVDITGNNVIFFPKTRASDIIYPNLSNLGKVTVNIENKLNNCCYHWIDGDADGSVYLSTASIQQNSIGYSSIAGGRLASVRGNDSIALGCEAIVSANNAIAIGKYSYVNADNSSTFGINTKVYSLNSTAIGKNIRLPSNNTMVVGTDIAILNSIYHTTDSFVIGSNINNISMCNSIIIAHNSSNSSTINSIVVAKSTELKKTSDSFVAGYNINGTNINNSIVIGHKTNCTDIYLLESINNSIAITSSTNIISSDSVVLSQGGEINAVSSTIVGKNINTQNVTSSVLMGSYINMENGGTAAVGIGSSITIAPRSIGIGSSLISNQSNSIAIGTTSRALGNNSIALGSTTRSTSEGSIAIGLSANSSGNNSIAIGTTSRAEADRSISIGGSYISGNGCVGIGNSAIINNNAENCLAISCFESNTLSPNFVNIGVGNSSIAMGQNIELNGNYIITVGRNVSMPIWANDEISEHMLVCGNNISLVNYPTSIRQNYPKDSIVLGENLRSGIQHSITIGNNIFSQTNSNLSTSVYGGSIIMGEGLRTNTALSIILGYNSNINSSRSLVIGNNIKLGINNYGTMTDSIVISNSSSIDIQRSIYVGVNSNSIKTAQDSIGMLVNARSFSDTSWEQPSGNYGRTMTRSLVVTNNSRIDCLDSIAVGDNVIIEHSTGCVSVGVNISEAKNIHGPQTVGSVMVGRNISKLYSKRTTDTKNDITLGSLMIGENITSGVTDSTPSGLMIGENIFVDCWPSSVSTFQTSSSIVMGKNVSTENIHESILIGQNSSNANEAACHSASVKSMQSSIAIVTNTNKSYNYAIGNMETSIAVVNGSKNIISGMRSSIILSNYTPFAGYKYRYYYNPSTNNISYQRIDLATPEGQTSTTNGSNGIIDCSSIHCSECVFNAPIRHSMIYGTKISLSGYTNMESMNSNALNEIDFLKLHANDEFNSIYYYPEGSNSSIIIGYNISGQSSDDSLIIGSNVSFRKSEKSIIIGGRVMGGNTEQVIVTGSNTRISGNLKNSILVGDNIYVNNSITQDVSVSAFGSNIIASLNDASVTSGSLTLVGKKSPSKMLSYEHTFVIADNNKWVFSASNDSIRGLAYSTMGSDYAEYMEWEDGNINNEDRCGRFVSLYIDNYNDNDMKIKLSSGEDDEYIIGIVSGSPSFIGNADMTWRKQYITDDFGRIKYITDSNGNKIPMINPDYNPEEVYVPRSERKEWDTIGLRGFVNTLDDGKCRVGCYVKPSHNGIATISEEVTKFMCVARISNNVVKVDIK